MKRANRILLAAIALFVVGMASGAKSSPATEDVPAVVRANTAFAVDLYRHLMTQEGNLFYSPYSISVALAMTCAGARGATEEDMARVLHFTKPQDRIAAGFSALSARFDAVSKSGAVLTVANALWCQKDFHLTGSFVQAAGRDYKATLGSVDFAADPRGAGQRINAWVENATHGKITTLVAPDGLSPATRLMVCNAVYFKSAWSEPFKPALTRLRPFYMVPQNASPVLTMHQRSRARIAHADGLSLLELPYKGNDLSMILVLPNARDGLPQIEQRLTAPNLDRWLAALNASTTDEIDIELPRFTMTQQFDLSRPLADMGMASAFNQDRADFSGMSGNRELWISRVVHKAYVEVNESGTEAAAATGVTMSATAYREVSAFHADHPFLFLIRENSTGAILFIGRVVDPR